MNFVTRNVLTKRMEKQCTGCGETKLLSEYHNKKDGKYGRASRCKVCKSLADKKYNASNEGKEYKKVYRKSVSGKAARKKYDASEKGRAKRKAYDKTYRESEAGKAVQKAYNQSEAGKASHKKYQKKRRHNDPVFKLQGNLRSGFCQWIKGHTKTCRTEQYVGCTYNELLEHLESQFEEGMTWENQGIGDNKWQIDHFKAQSRFDPTMEEEAFKCWHWTNLQPMWSSENNKYSNKKKPGDEFVIWMDREIGWVNIEDVINKKTKLNLKIEKEEV